MSESAPCPERKAETYELERHSHQPALALYTFCTSPDANRRHGAHERQREHAGCESRPERIGQRLGRDRRTWSNRSDQLDTAHPTDEHADDNRKEALEGGFHADRPWSHPA